jgi:putative peptidoglycan lipid II flippase
MVYDFLVGGAISAALVPVFVEAAEEESRLWRLVSAILSLAGLLLLTVATVLALSADLLIDVLGAGFEPWQHAEAVTMVRVMMIAVVLQGLAGVLMAALYARNQFAVPSFAPAVYNGAVILLAVLLHSVLGVQALVVGVLLGAFGQLVLQLVGLRPLHFHLGLNLRLPEVRVILRLYAPVAAGLLVSFVGITIDRYLASQLEAGSMTVMAYATRLIQFPLGLVGTATSMAVLPTLARHAAGMLGPNPEPDRLGYRDTLRYGIKIVLLLMLPATLGLAMLSEPLVRLLFEHRAFTSYDTLRTATVFLFYAPQLPFTALDQVLIYAYYARRDTVTPVLVGVLSIGIYLLVALTTRDALGVYGLALANTAQNSLHGLILLGLIWRLLRGLDLPELLGYSGRILLAAILMAAALWSTAQLLQPLLDRSLLGLIALLALQVLVGASVFGAAVLALRVPEARQLLLQLSSRLRR